jgi:hypothetical protein
MEYPRDWQTVDLKAFAKEQLKCKQIFLLSAVQKIVIDARKVSTSDSLDGEPTPRSVLKRGKNFNPFRPTALAPQNVVKVEKKRDVMRLLNTIGVSEEHGAFRFYDKICNTVNSDNEHSSNPSDSE